MSAQMNSLAPGHSTEGISTLRPFLFYDGHLQSLKSVAINQALYDPGKQ